MPEPPAPPPKPAKPWHEVLVALTPLIIGVGVTGVAAFYTQMNNARQLQLNQIAALDKFRPLLVSEDDADRAFAYASFEALGYRELALKIIQSKRDSAGRAVVETIKATGSGAEQADAAAALTVIPARVYLHIGDEAQRSWAGKLGQTLRGAGYAVQGVEKVAAVPGSTGVRYFNDEDRAAAEAIAQTLRANGAPDAAAQQVKRYKVRPGSVEVWLAASAGPQR